MGRRNECEGLSLVEVMATAMVLIIMVWMFTTLSISGTRAQKFAGRLNRATEIAQDLTDDMRRELVSSVRLFHDDAIGRAYLALLSFKGMKGPIGHRLPKLSATGIFDKDGASPKTGNTLLFARHAWSTPFRTSKGNVYRVDVYRLVHYFLTPEDGGPHKGSPSGLDMVKWVSEPLADGDTIDKITDTGDRAEVLGHLVNRTPDLTGRVHPGVQVVWLRGRDPADAKTLRHIQPSGVLTDNPQPPRAAPWRILPDTGLSVNGLLHYRRHSIATNFAPNTYGIGRFGTISPAGSGFPHGFEVQIIGPASARQVLVRLVVVSTNLDGHHAHAESQVIVDARDL